MPTVLRYKLQNMPKDGKLAADHPAVKNAVIHWVLDSTTACGKEIPSDDPRWHVDSKGVRADINCTRCLAALEPKSDKPKEKKAKAPKAAKSDADVPRHKDGTPLSKKAQAVLKETSNGGVGVPKPPRKSRRKPAGNAAVREYAQASENGDTQYAPLEN